jgi:hypothetical protein
MRTPRPLHFSRRSIPTCPACPELRRERSRSQIPTLSERIYPTPSQSHFGSPRAVCAKDTHPSLIPKKDPSLFSNTYGDPFCNPLCFQKTAGMGGGSPLHPQTLSRSCAESLPSHDATFASRTVLREEEPAPAHPEERSVTSLDATLMELPVSVANKRLTEELTPLDATLTKNTGGGALPSFAIVGSSRKIFLVQEAARRSLHYPSSQHGEEGSRRGRWILRLAFGAGLGDVKSPLQVAGNAERVDSEGDAGDNSLSARTRVGAPITEEWE